MAELDLSMSAGQVFTPKERDANEASKAVLFELITSGQALLFVGAGSSVQAGYVTWPQLMKELEQLACEYAPGFIVNEPLRRDDPLHYADLIKDHILKHTGSYYRFTQHLYYSFAPNGRNCTDLHRLLVALPFRGILTTNYDRVLEVALSEHNPQGSSDNSFVLKKELAVQCAEFFYSFDDTAAPRRIGHIHGRYDEAERLILSYNDYLQSYGYPLGTGPATRRKVEWTLHRKVLWAILATRRVVFVGFSMTDPYLNLMLQSVADDIWTWNKPQHFAIMGISPATRATTLPRAQELRRRYGVEVVFYENLDGRHTGFQQLIGEIAERCGVPTHSSENFLKWLDSANSRMEESL